MDMNMTLVEKCLKDFIKAPGDAECFATSCLFNPHRFSSSSYCSFFLPHIDRDSNQNEGKNLHLIGTCDSFMAIFCIRPLINR